MSESITAHGETAIIGLPADEVLIAVWREPLDGSVCRGEQLAKALGGRFAKGSGTYFLTYGRALKWRLLWEAGFTAKQKKIEGIAHWRFDGCGRLDLMRADAIDLARRANRLAAAKEAQ